MKFAINSASGLMTRPSRNQKGTDSVEDAGPFGWQAKARYLQNSTKPLASSHGSEVQDTFWQATLSRPAGRLPLAGRKERYRTATVRESVLLIPAMCYSNFASTSKAPAPLGADVGQALSFRPPCSAVSRADVASHPVRRANHPELALLAGRPSGAPAV
jgi:hypothetical protein